jgi:hypothetical protein
LFLSTINLAAQEGAERGEYLIDMMEALKSETPFIIDFARAMGGLIHDPPPDGRGYVILSRN